MNSPASETPRISEKRHVGFVGRKGRNEGFTGGNDTEAGGRSYQPETPRTSHKTKGGSAGRNGGQTTPRLSANPSVRASSVFCRIPARVRSVAAERWQVAHTLLTRALFALVTALALVDETRAPAAFSQASRTEHPHLPVPPSPLILEAP